MKQYTVRITDKALADMEEIYNYIAIQLEAPENAMRQYNRIAEAIEGLHIFPERAKLMESEPERMIVKFYIRFFSRYFLSGVFLYLFYCFCNLISITRVKEETKVTNIMKNTLSLKLVNKAAKGNRDAFGELIIMHQEYLYRLAYMYTKNEQDALDAVQECAMRAMIAMDKLREPVYFKTWITRILINSIYMERKKNRNNSPFEKYSEAAPEPPLSIEEKTDLYDAIDLLPPVYKTVVVLKYFQEMKIKDIAQIMDIPVGSVKAYLFRAKEALKNQIQGWEESE